MAFKIITSRADVSAFVQDVQSAADTDREALGFLPRAAYEGAVQKGEITLAVCDEFETAKYAGHIWVSGTYPHARVVQLFVAPEYRGQRLATRLLRSAIQTAEAFGYLSIKANVAADLAANRIYDHLGFEIVRTRAGGRVRNRQINIRIRELATPTLFNYRPASSITFADSNKTPDAQPLYLIDLNVFFDATRKRRATPAAERILAAALRNGVRLAVTTEFIKELQRSAISKDDPVLSFAKQLPTVTGPSRAEIETLALRIAQIVFPERAISGQLSTNDRSDLRHLAEAILVGAAGFVTGERAIIRADARLREQHHLSVWSTEEFADLVTPAFEEVDARGDAEHDLFFREATLDHETTTFLTDYGVTTELVADFSRRDAADSRFRYVAAREADTLVAFSCYRAATGPSDEASLLLVVNPRHPSTPTAADFLVEHAVRASTVSRPSRVALAHVSSQSMARRSAIANGFVAIGSGSEAPLRKISIGRVVTPSSWATLRCRLEDSTGLSLPVDCPTFENDEQDIRIALDGVEATISLSDLESMLAPGLLLLPGRPAAIVPIRRTWAEDLIGGTQLGLFPKPEAAFRSRRVYFAGVANRYNIVRGRPIILYESSKQRGSGAAIAVARVSKAEVLPKANAPDSLLRAAVVRGSQLDQLVKGTSVLAVWFDNIMRFERPVSFQNMEGLGMDDKTKLVKSHLLNFETAVQIVDAGQPNAR